MLLSQLKVTLVATKIHTCVFLAEPAFEAAMVADCFRAHTTVVGTEHHRELFVAKFTVWVVVECVLLFDGVLHGKLVEAFSFSDVFGILDFRLKIRTRSEQWTRNRALETGSTGAKHD